MSGNRVSRRSMLGSVGAVSLSPALASVTDIAGPAASPELPRARPAFAATLQTGAIEQSASGSRCASIIGGFMQGRRLSGTVQAGRIEWSVPADGAPVEVTTQLLVSCTDGSLVEVQDRGVLPADADPASHAAIPTRPELTGGREEPDVPVLLVGRLDASELGKGILKLQAFEVS